MKPSPAGAAVLSTDTYERFQKPPHHARCAGRGSAAAAATAAERSASHVSAESVCTATTVKRSCTAPARAAPLDSTLGETRLSAGPDPPSSAKPNWLSRHQSGVEATRLPRPCWKSVSFTVRPSLSALRW